MRYVSVSITPSMDGPWVARVYLRDSVRTVQGHPRRIGGCITVTVPGTEGMDAEAASAAVTRMLAVEDGHAPARSSRRPVYPDKLLPGLG